MVGAVGRVDHLLLDRGLGSALAGQGVDDAGDGGADFRGDAARCQVEAEQDAHETVPELQAGELVERPHGDGEQRDERDRDSQVAITSLPVGGRRRGDGRESLLALSSWRRMRALAWQVSGVSGRAMRSARTGTSGAYLRADFAALGPVV